MTWKPGWPGLVARTAAGIGALVIGAAGERDRPPRDPRVSAQASAAAASIWIEGEAAEATTFNRHGWYCCDGVRSDLLSPGVPGSASGDWLSHYANNDAREVTATYRFEVTAAGRRVLWLRASVYQVRSWWRLDDGPAVDVDLATEARERLNLVAPAIDIRFLAWVRAGVVDMNAGAHRLTVGLAGHPSRRDGREVHGGLDAIVLVPEGEAWAPTGGLRPPDPARPAPVPAASDWFPLVPIEDAVSADSVTDASALVERPAGARGPVRAVGDGLAFADGTPVRFWGVNALPMATPEKMARQARYYAKHGVNLVRIHPVESIVGVLRRGPDGQRLLDPAGLDRLDRWFAALKDAGIYVSWSPFYPHVITSDDDYPADLYAELPDANAWNLPAGTVGKSSSGYVNYIPALQEAEWTWLASLLEHRNPYTGLRYVDDPALAIVEVHNEDSIFWHAPLNDLEAGRAGPRHIAELQRQWQAWVRAHYPSDGALRAAWGPVGRGSRDGDSRDNPRLGIYGAWEMQADGPSRNRAESKRMGDFIRFLAETQRGYFEHRRDALRAHGYDGLTISTAWQAGGPAAHLANLWTDDAMDVIDRHAYFGGGAGGHQVGVGDVNSASHLGTLDGGILARGYEQVEGKPFMLSEWTQSPPNEWKAEIAPLVAFYGFGLGGWDASTHFSAGRADLGGGWPDEDSYVTETPSYIGQFPALARAVHRGDFTQGPLIAARRLAIDDAFLGIDALAQGAPSGGWGGGGGPLALPLGAQLMGRVTVKVGDGLAPSTLGDVRALVDPVREVIRSATGELAWHVAESVVVADGARTQAVVGFAANKAFTTGAFEVAFGETTFASLILTSLDDAPLSASRKVLVTALARDRQTGARYSVNRRRLEAVGGPPLLMEPVQARIGLRSGTIRSARALRPDGVPVGGQVEHDGRTVQIDGRSATYLYVLEIEREGAVSPSPTATRGTATPPATPSAGAPTPANTRAATTEVPGTPAGPTATPPTAPARTRLWLPLCAAAWPVR